mmetsp:Transcript_4488/g.16102  ORF Transcript_4488/g.16102 Transcript_4488/m.16102 type:complete len:312 (-) Transcript_4488:66-1001(-)
MGRRGPQFLPRPPPDRLVSRPSTGQPALLCLEYWIRMTSWQKETFLFSRLGFSEDDVDIPFTAMAAGGSGSALLALELPSSSLAELPSLNSDSEFAESNRPVVSGVEGRSEDEASPLALSPTIFSDDRPGLFFRFSFAALMTSLSRLFTFLSFTIVIVFGLKISRADSLHDGKTCCPSLLDDSDGSRFLNSTSCSPPAACSGYFSFEKHIPIFISCIQVCLPPSLFPGKDSRPASRGCRRLDPLGLSPLSPPASELQNPLYVHPQRTQEKNTQKKNKFGRSEAETNTVARACAAPEVVQRLPSGRPAPCEV